MNVGCWLEGFANIDCCGGCCPPGVEPPAAFEPNPPGEGALPERPKREVGGFGAPKPLKADALFDSFVGGGPAGVVEGPPKNEGAPVGLF